MYPGGIWILRKRKHYFYLENVLRYGKCLLFEASHAKINIVVVFLK